MVATRQGASRQEILGIGRLIKVPGANEAEFAIVISDQWQGHGLGTYLLKVLLDIGRQEGLGSIFGHILTSIVSINRTSIWKRSGVAEYFPEYSNGHAIALAMDCDPPRPSSGRSGSHGRHPSCPGRNQNGYGRRGCHHALFGVIAPWN